MVKTNGVAMWLLMIACAGTDQAEGLFGRKTKVTQQRQQQSDQVRVQAARLKRLECRIEQMSVEGALLTEKARQHREMRLKSSIDLKVKVDELKSKMQEERERMQKDFQDQVTAVREEMWAQAARDRDALEAELGLRHKEERDILLQEAAERADEMIKEVKVKMEEEAERDRELYTQRVALAEEGQELAKEDRKQLQDEKDQLVQQLQEAMEMEELNRRKIIMKFKMREDTLRKKFEAQLREVMSTGGGGGSAGATGNTSKRPRASKPKSTLATSSNGEREGSPRASVKSSSGPSPNGGGGGVSMGTTGAPSTPQR